MYKILKSTRQLESEVPGEKWWEIFVYFFGGFFVTIQIVKKLCVDISFWSVSSYVHLRRASAVLGRKPSPRHRVNLYLSQPRAHSLQPLVCWQLLGGGWVTDLQDQLLVSETCCGTAQDWGARWFFTTISGLSFDDCHLKTKETNRALYIDPTRRNPI